jgi:hypothetical protein
MGLNYYASSSPVLTLTPEPQHQANYFGNHYQQDSTMNTSAMNAAPFTSSPAQTMTDAATSNATSSSTIPGQSAVNRKPVRPRFPRPPSINYLANASASSISGRKRSIADVHEGEPQVDLDGSITTPQSELPPSPTKPKGEPIMGPGMTLIYPDDPRYNAVQAGSQTGTWVEQNVVEAEQASVRPSVSSRKSQRREVPETIIVEAPENTLVNEVITSASTVPSDEPVDKLSIILGVGWKRLPPAQAPAAKGWEKYILNHYSSIEDPSILLFNEGLHAYLVRAISASNDTQECWWVFQEDLSACRLVGHYEDDAIRSLQSSESIAMGPIVYAHKQSCHRSIPSINEPFFSLDEPFSAIATPPTTAALVGANDVEMQM